LRELNIRWLGKLPYGEAYILQKGLHAATSQESSPFDYLLLLEHNNVVTIGRSGDINNLLVSKNILNENNIEFFETDRGGDITFHGDGQLIGYPIIRLDDPKKVVPFVRKIENVIIDSLAELSIEAFSKTDDTGVWTKEGKIASIGIKVSKWTTLHGFSLNISENTKGFDFINPCGSSNEHVVSIQQYDETVSFKEVTEIISRKFVEIFKYEKVDKQFSQFTPRQLKKKKEFHIDQLVNNGVFNASKNSVPITLNSSVKSEPERPEWMKVKANLGKDYLSLKSLIKEKRLNTVCEEASCPNIYECWSMGTATFMIMGDTCTRACGFCDVNTGKPCDLDMDEPYRVAESVKIMGLTHAVITSVNRDDLDDGGASQIFQCVSEVRKISPETTIELLIPDLCGNWQALELVLDSKPNVLNHNIETVKGLYRKVRPQGNYQRTLDLLKRTREYFPSVYTKSGFMLGLGESDDEVLNLLSDLKNHFVDIVTIGQYLSPGPKHLPVQRFVSPSKFNFFKLFGEDNLGFMQVVSSPLTRSSYHAEEIQKLMKKYPR